jgi:hypothetical protein
LKSLGRKVAISKVALAISCFAISGLPLNASDLPAKTDLPVHRILPSKDNVTIVLKKLVLSNVAEFVALGSADQEDFVIGRSYMYVLTDARANEVAASKHRYFLLSACTEVERDKDNYNEDGTKIYGKGQIVTFTKGNANIVNRTDELFKNYDYEFAGKVMKSLGLRPGHVYVVQTKTPLKAWFNQGANGLPDFAAEEIDGFSKEVLDSWVGGSVDSIENGMLYGRTWTSALLDWLSKPDPQKDEFATAHGGTVNDAGSGNYCTFAPDEIEEDDSIEYTFE